MHRSTIATLSVLAGLSQAAQAQPAEGSLGPSLIDPVGSLELAQVQLDFHPDARGLNQIIRTLLRAPGVTPEIKAAVADSTKAAEALQNSGRGQEARRTLNQAIRLLQGAPWDAKAEFGASLSLRLNTPVNDPSRPVLGQLVQDYAAPYRPITNLQLTLSLAEVTRRPSSRPDDSLTVPGRVLKAMGSFDVPARDMNDNPYHFAANVGAIADGAYAVVADISDGSIKLGRATATVTLIQDIEARNAATEKALVAIKDHDDTKASIRYPFEMIRMGHSARIKTKWYDHLDGMRRSAELLKALEAGKDLLYQAKGDLQRHYHFADANEIMPYRVYVPSSWNATKALPLVVILRGSNGDENSMLSWGDGAVQKLAERHAFVVVAPLGYRIDGTFGVRFPVPVGLKSTPFGLPEPAHTVAAMQFSEADTLNVIDRVAAEYHTDAKRTYITGNSQGGGGSWTLTARYPQRFAAAAPCASSNDLRGMPFENFKSVPVLTCVGQFDVDERKFVQRYLVEKINAAGGNAKYLEVAQGTHNTGVELAMSEIFEFFRKNQKK